jgi:predicted tellurium resistance membrane protein TerC
LRPAEPEIPAPAGIAGLIRQFPYLHQFSIVVLGSITVNLMLKKLFIRPLCGNMRGFYGAIRFGEIETGTVFVLFNARDA